MKSHRLTAATLFALTLVSASAADDFRILIERTSRNEKQLSGTILINGSVIGTSYENDNVRIPPGTYKGLMHFSSSKNFLKGPGGVMSQQGDFLLEISGVRVSGGAAQTAILLHGGDKPQQSQGCILLGPVDRGLVGQSKLTADHPLYKLRIAFYGSGTPDDTPNKTVTIEIRDDIPRPEGLWQWLPKDQKVTLNADGTCISTYNVTGTWMLIEGTKRTFKIQWKNGFIDTLTLSADNNSLTGANQGAKHPEPFTRIK